MKSTYKKAKIPFPKIDYFQSLKKNVPPEIFKLFELKYNDQIIISLIAFKWQNILYAHYIGTYHDKDILRLRPVDFFYGELFRWCSANGIQYYNWMGAGSKNKDMV